MRRRKEQRGAALVEFALVVPILMMLVFGVIEFGNNFNSSLALRSGTRDGARQAAVGNFGADAGTGASTCSLTPSTGDTETDEIICLTKARIGLDNTKVRVDVLLGANGYVVGEPIVVCAQTPMSSLTGLFSPILNGKFLTTKVQMRIETANASAPSSGHENAPTGGNWNFCTVQ